MFGNPLVKILASLFTKLFIKQIPLNGAEKQFLFLNYELPLGAAVLATPIFEVIKSNIARSKITVACSAITRETLEFNPFIDEILSTPHPLKDFFYTVVSAFKYIRPRRNEFDCVVTNSGNARTRITIIALLSGVRPRIGYAVHPEFFDYPVKKDEEKSVLQNNLKVLEEIGISAKGGKPGIYFPLDTVAQINEKISGIFKSRESEDFPLIAIVSQASGMNHPNNWIEERFVELCNRLFDEFGARILFTGTVADEAKVEALRKNISAPTGSVAGETSISQLAAIFAGCDLVIGVDTGSMHVARAVEVPAIILAPANNPRNVWLPENDPLAQVIIFDDIHCAGCRKIVCMTRECMDAITVDAVFEAAKEMIDIYPPSVETRTYRQNNWSVNVKTRIVSA